MREQWIQPQHNRCYQHYKQQKYNKYQFKKRKNGNMAHLILKQHVEDIEIKRITHSYFSKNNTVRSVDVFGVCGNWIGTIRRGAIEVRKEN